MKKSISRKKSGFTLIEMLIVITIIAILAGIVLPRFASTSDSAKKSAHKAERQNINGQIEIYYFNSGTYPADMTSGSWAEGAHDYKYYFPDGVPVSCNQGTAWAIDSATNRIAIHAGHE